MMGEDTEVEVERDSEIQRYGDKSEEEIEKIVNLERELDELEWEAKMDDNTPDPDDSQLRKFVEGAELTEPIKATIVDIERVEYTHISYVKLICEVDKTGEKTETKLRVYDDPEQYVDSDLRQLLHIHDIVPGEIAELVGESITVLPRPRREQYVVTVPKDRFSQRAVYYFISRMFKYKLLQFKPLVKKRYIRPSPHLIALLPFVGFGTGFLLTFIAGILPFALTPILVIGNALLLFSFFTILIGMGYLIQYVFELVGSRSYNWFNPF